ncbi:uncharacterized protein TNCV_3974561 [Trichonephila clavipes]|nr:uncharacterized protein TNCV_3974561 [Trichonephila clavipes]
MNEHRNPVGSTAAYRAPSPGKKEKKYFLREAGADTCVRLPRTLKVVLRSAGLSVGCLGWTPRGPDKLDIKPDFLFINFDPPKPRGPVDLLRPEPEMSLNRHWNYFKQKDISNSVTQQPMRAYCAHPSIRDHWALRYMSRCPDQVASLKRDPQCLSPQASLVLIYRPTDEMKG